MSEHVKVFQEAIISTIVPIEEDATLYALRAFGDEAMVEYVVAATLGLVVATAILMLVGHLLAKLTENQVPDFIKERRDELMELVSHQVAFAPLFMWLPIGFMIGMAAGYFKANRIYALLCAAIGGGTYYSIRMFA